MRHPVGNKYSKKNSAEMSAGCNVGCSVRGWKVRLAEMSAGGKVRSAVMSVNQL